ncbi:DUF4145 domain-containing protein [Clostridium paraputrificum]|uniref:DUF4145 domain-containing protein n=1 Tax=Clostridium paraputrificum TaxID=29363 RepID=UPI001899102B|nr:DUF4145 domain-containing protein [Clostridium paraputrificum]MDC0803500.1 DUF4145 domain-containing protein [Clostridium paraputrificum]
MKVVDFEEMAQCYSNYADYCAKLDVDRIDECPLCHLKISPNLIGEAEGKFYYTLLQCPNCGELFIVKYATRVNRRTYAGFECDLIGIYPKTAQNKCIPEKIKEISPMFVEIYNQANGAEAHSLYQLVGIGYRKALEFLVKDYLKFKDPDKKDEIESEFLGKCINKIENSNIKKMAKGATWIGNDETHYVKRWENKDITDLKNLIDLTLIWIDLELKTEEYSKDMCL